MTKVDIRRWPGSRCGIGHGAGLRATVSRPNDVWGHV